MPADDVLIDVSGGTPTIEITTGSVTVHNLLVRENLNVSSENFNSDWACDD